MGVRGIVRDIISLYLGYEVIRSYVFGGSLSVFALVAAIILLSLSIWFIFERIGILQKL